MNYVLNCFYAVNRERPALLIPGFTREGSNAVFTHDLDVAGKVQRFLILNEDELARADVLMVPNIELSIGDDGLFAIQDIGKQIFYGNIRDLREHFVECTYAGSILAIEGAALLGDPNRLNDALESLDWKYSDSDSFRRWADLERRSFSSVLGIRKQKNIQDTNSGRFEIEFKSLTESPESLSWSRVWSKLWHAGYRREDLVKVACWRVESGYEILPDSGSVYMNVSHSGRGKNDYVNRHCVTWLRRASYGISGWTAVLSNVRASDRFRSDADEIVFENLSRHATLGVSVAPWIRLWTFAWGRGMDRESLTRIASQHLRSHPRSSDDHGMMFIYLLRQEGTIEEFYDTLVEWLANHKKNAVIWSDLFLKVADFQMDEGVAETGKTWCRYWGGTMSSWYEIWRRIGREVDEDEHLDIASAWLSRSRWDLRVWPKVFVEAGMKVRNNDRLRERFSRVGNAWLSSGYHHGRRWQDVEKVLRYLDDR